MGDDRAAADGVCAVVNSVGRGRRLSDPTWIAGDRILRLPMEEWLAGMPVPHPQWAFTRSEVLPMGVLFAIG